LIELFLRVSLVGAAFALGSSPQPTPNAPTHESLHACEDSAAVAEVEVRGPAFEFAIDAANASSSGTWSVQWLRTSRMLSRSF